MNDSAMRLMMLAHRERLLSTMGHTRASPERLADDEAMCKEGPMERIVAAFVVAILSSVIAFSFLFDERMSQLAAWHAPGIASTEGAQTGRPATTAAASVSGMASSDVQQANHQ